MINHRDIILDKSNNWVTPLQTVFFFHKTLLWNFKYCCVLIRNVFYWFNVKQSMSNHCFIVSRYSFLIGFTIKISKSWMLNWFLVEGPETIKKFCTLHFLSKPDTCASPVTIVKPHKKNVKFIFEWLLHHLLQYREMLLKCQFWRDWYWTFKRKKWWTLITTYTKYFKQNIIIVVLRKVNSY